jgi:amino acid adenylation domain-containing protein/thioester reductase-like protein
VLSVEANCSIGDLCIRYRCPVIPRHYAQAVAHTFRKILTDMVGLDPCGEMETNVISMEDKQRVVSWNPKHLYSQMTCLHYLVEAVTRAIPTSEAVCSWDGSLTYSQLNKLSSVVAQRLTHANVTTGVYVPLAFEKSLWTVVAALGILKAGGAFVPIDPNHPTSRIEKILSDLDARVLVTSQSFKTRFKDLVEQVVIVNAQTIKLPEFHQMDDVQLPEVRPQDPVYVLFTSGSTGRPKGMIHEHGAICSHTIAHGEAMGYQGARVLQFAAHTFDVAIFDIFTTLVFGGCVCIPSEEDRMNDIVHVIESMKANFAILTPSFASLLDPREVPTLQTVVIGGEALTQEGNQRWADRLSLQNIYGPAEVGICLMMKIDTRGTRPETVGYPLKNASCWLVDPEDPNRLVPIGAVGELVIAGPSLAQGYLNNEEKTRSSFIEDPSWAVGMGLQHRRFFKSGDLLRYNIESFDGSYDFVRRKDTQIKLRGQRIEAGEVEHYLANIPRVAISMVDRPTRGCFAGELVAIIQMRSAHSHRMRNDPISLATSQSLSLETLQSHLSQHLPGYMIPTVCLVIESMPFVPSLKINRIHVSTWLNSLKSNPLNEVAGIAVNGEASALDRDEKIAINVSSKIAELVAQNDTDRRAGLEGRELNLQKAGMNSIQIISLSMWLQRKFEVKIPLEILFSSKTTIRDLAHLVNSANELPSLFTEVKFVDVLLECDILVKQLTDSFKSSASERSAEEQMPVRNVLVTGASGYLGSGILEQLFFRPELQIFSLVRCLTEAEGLRRIIDLAIRAGWWQDDFRSRLHVWIGDLTKDHLGLEREQVQRLSGGSQEDLCIHAVIHSGATVHYSFDYEALKSTNVHPTLELLKMAAQSRCLSKFIYVSGGQRPSVDEAKKVPEAVQTFQNNGYGQSKYVSELLVQSCVDLAPFHRKQLYTVKPGYIIGSLRTGIANQSDFIWRLIAGCLEVEAYNKDEALHWLFMSDVESVAKEVVSGVFDLHESGKKRQVVDGLLFSDLWDLLEKVFGYKLEPLAHEEWLKRLQEVILTKQESHPLFPLINTLEREGGSIGSQEAPIPRTDWMVAVVKRNVQHLIEVGFLPAPPGPAPITSDACSHQVDRHSQGVEPEVLDVVTEVGPPEIQIQAF